MNRPQLAGADLGAMFKSMQDAQPNEVDIDLIDVKPQVREKFENDEQSLEGLAETIKLIGVLQPILLRSRPAGRYELVAGERRLRAAKLAGLKKIPCKIRTFKDGESSMAQLIENLQRMELEPLEEANALKEQLALHNNDRSALLKALGRPKGDAWLSQRLSLLDLPPESRRLVESGLSKDVTTINQLRQVERHDPAMAKALVDSAAANPGAGTLRQTTAAAAKQVKPANTAKKNTPQSAGSKPSVATPRDRSQEEPGPGATSPGGGVFPTPPMKPHERAITALVEAAKKPGAEAVKLAEAVPTTDRDLMTRHGKEFFERGKQTVDLAPALIAGLTRNEFGKAPVELFNLTAFLLGRGEAEFFTVDAVITAIASANK